VGTDGDLKMSESRPGVSALSWAGTTLVPSNWSASEMRAWISGSMVPCDVLPRREVETGGLAAPPGCA
jgi:hypothetical protein